MRFLICVVAVALQGLLCVADSPAPAELKSAPGDLQSAPGALKAAPAPDRENQLESDILHHFQHLTYVADFVCREPQARIVPVDKLLPSATTWGKAYYPDVTVIHLCENAGACSSGYRCGPSHVNSVHLPFKVTYLEDIDYHKKGSWSMEFHLLENHTHCACAEEQGTERPRPMTLPVTPPAASPSRPYGFNPGYNPSFNNNNPSFSNNNPSFSNNSPSFSSNPNNPSFNNNSPSFSSNNNNPSFSTNPNNPSFSNNANNSPSFSSNSNTNPSFSSNPNNPSFNSNNPSFNPSPIRPPIPPPLSNASNNPRGQDGPQGASQPQSE